MFGNSNNNSRIARPSSMILTSSVHVLSQPIHNVRQRIPNEPKKKQQQQQPQTQAMRRSSSRMSKSQSMHRFDYLSDDEDDTDYRNQYLSLGKPQIETKKRPGLLSRATTTPYVPKPSSLIKRFSYNNASVLTTTKTSHHSDQAMKRSSSLMNPAPTLSDHVSGDLVSVKENDFRLGQRVAVPSLNAVGTIKFIGETKFTGKHGTWIGIELDIKGSGKNDGSVQGIRYFSCPPESGIFVLPSKVIVLEGYNHCQKITPRASKTTTTTAAAAATTTKKSNSSSTQATNKRKSMILPSRPSTVPKRNQPNPSKSARPFPTRSSPSESQKRPKNQLQSSSSLSTPTRDDLNRIQSLLDQSREESRVLAQQMDGKEAAWEKLVSVKESYAVLVQEKEDEISRLRRRLDQIQPDKLTAERDAALSRASMSEAMERQHVKVIERLEARIGDLQTRLTDQVGQHESQRRDSAAQLDQIRKQLLERDEATATVERELAELQRTHVDSLRAFEHSVRQLQADHLAALQAKQNDIDRLRVIVNDYQYQLYPTTPSTPIDDENSPRRRLEAQLDLTTRELDRERGVIKTMTAEINQLKEEIKRLHRASVCSSSQFYSIRNELETEIEDKRRIMEEANAAIESQSRLEEENERLKMTLDKTQHHLTEVLEKLSLLEKPQSPSQVQEDLISRCKLLEQDHERLQTLQRQTEHECLRLMDELLAIEKADKAIEDRKTLKDEKTYLREIEQLKLQVIRETKRCEELEKANQVKVAKYHKELSHLESLVENKVFNETELEETIETEKQKTRLLEAKLREEEEKNKDGGWLRSSLGHIPLSPTSPQYSLFHHQKQQKRSSTGSFSLMTSSSLDTVSDHGNLLESVYCEICEEYGHDVMTCNAIHVYSEEEYTETTSFKSTYCVNCDVFDTHPTEKCPNQDETF